MHRHLNGLKTAALLGLLTGLILAVGWWFGGRGGLIIAVLISLVMNAVSYFYSDKIALRAMRAQPVTQAEAPQLYAMVNELATAAHQPMPAALHQPDRPAQRVRDRPQPGARRRLRDRRASSACSPRASCAA